MQLMKILTGECTAHISNSFVHHDFVLKRLVFVYNFSENYESCLGNLSKIKPTKETERKILHNKVVVEFYRNGFKNYNEFRKNLDEIIGEMPNLSVQAFDIKDLSLAIPLFNKAVVLFQLRQSHAALKIILVLLKHLDAFDIDFAQKIGLLAIQLVLNLNQPKKAEAIITLLKLRLNSSTDLLGGSDEDDDSLLEKLINPYRAQNKPLTEFRWMFRLYRMRSKVLNEKSIIIPNEEVSMVTHMKYCETSEFLGFYDFYNFDDNFVHYFILRHRKCLF